MRELRKQTFTDCIAEKQLFDLPIVFIGTLEEIQKHVRNNYQLEWHNNKSLFGGFWYSPPTKDKESFSLLVT